MKASRQSAPTPSTSNRALRGVAAVAATALAVTGCGTGATTPAAGDSGPIVIEVPYLGSTTGPAATLAYEIDESAKLAVAEINSRNLGFTIELKQVDSAQNPAQAVSNFREVSKDAVVVMGGFTNEASAVAPLAKQAGVPYIAGLVSVLTIATNNRPWAHVATGDITKITNQGAQDWLKLTGVKAVSAIFNQSFDATVGQDKALTEGAAAAGVTVAENLGFQTGTTDYASIVRRALAANPDGLLIATQPGDTPAVMSEIRKQGSQAKILLAQSSWSGTLFSSAGAAVPGAYVIGQWFPGLGLGPSQAYEDKFKAATGKLPSYNFDYESWMLLGDALSKTDIKGKSTNDARAAIQQALTTATATSLTGEQIKFNDQGFVDRSGVLVQIQDDGSLQKTSAP